MAKDKEKWRDKKPSNYQKKLIISRTFARKGGKYKGIADLAKKLDSKKGFKENFEKWKEMKPDYFDKNKSNKENFKSWLNTKPENIRDFASDIFSRISSTGMRAKNMSDFILNGEAEINIREQIEEFNVGDIDNSRLAEKFFWETTKDIWSANDISYNERYEAIKSYYNADSIEEMIAKWIDDFESDISELADVYNDWKNGKIELKAEENVEDTSSELISYVNYSQAKEKRNSYEEKFDRAYNTNSKSTKNNKEFMSDYLNNKLESKSSNRHEA